MDIHNIISKKALILYSLFGVFYPTVVVIVELITHMCSQDFFDPIPTIWHIILVLLVPLSNSLICYQLASRGFSRIKWLLFLAALSIGISFFYSLLFLPLTPLAVIAIPVMGLGLLPLAPLASFIAAILLYRRLKKSLSSGESDTSQSHSSTPVKSYLWQGLTASFLCLCLLDLSATITNIGLQWATQKDSRTHAKGIQLLRNFGNEDLLLRLCYSDTGAVSGPLSFITSVIRKRDQFISTHELRQIFYQVTGESFNARPLPERSVSRRDFNDWTFDPDQGGVNVGGRIRNLDLLSSRIDGTVDANDGVGYIEWTLEFENNDYRNHEARLQFSLPNGAVVSRATLWVNGEEREAAFAGKAQVRAAYESVVRTQRDPLLVTTNGGNQVMAQAFPIMSRGGTIKFRIGMTVPLVINALDSGQLALPVIIDRNFGINNVKHAVWIESKTGALTTNFGPELKGSAINNKRFRIEGSVDDKTLVKLRSGFAFKRNTNETELMSSLFPNIAIKQSLKPIKQDNNFPVMILIDSSQTLRTIKKDLINSLAAIGKGRYIGLTIATEEPIIIAPKKWDEAHHKTIATAIEQQTFVGGQDNIPALVASIKSLETYKNSEILWVHSAQPIRFNRSIGQLEQTMERIQSRPTIALYPISLGTNKIIEEPALAFHTKSLLQTGSTVNDLNHYFSPSAKRYTFKREQLTQADTVYKKGSDHIARLWANEEIQRLMQADANNHNAAIALAAKYQLVTPVSGAVVLENQQQYDANNLTPVDAESVPTIPEPHQWVAIITILILLLWYIARRPSRLLPSA